MFGRQVAFIQQSMPPRRYDQYDTRSQLLSARSFSDKEIQQITNRFNKMAVNNVLTYEQFRNSLGILGVSHAQFLSERIFKLIDRHNHNKITLDDFIDYLNVIVNGTQTQKAQMSFRFLDHQNKGRVLTNDIEKLCSDVVIFWNYMTESRQVPDQAQVQRLIHALDYDKTGVITFQSYLRTYEKVTDVLDWQEFFNEQTQVHVDVHSNAELYKQAKLDQSINILQDQLFACMLELKVDGPFYVCRQQAQKNGDVDPLQEVSSTHHNHNYNQESYMNNPQQTASEITVLEDRIKNMERMFQSEDEESYDPKNASQKRSIEIRRATIANLDKQKAIYFGHENWNLILNMMIGMRKAVKSLQPFDITLNNTDFKDKYIHDIIIQRTSQHKISFKFIDYAPLVFERIRQSYKITQKMYLRSVGPENMLGNLILGRLSSLSELSSSGKSGSFFYFTDDSKYMIKTISKNEFTLLRKQLKNYYSHLQKYPNTLISRIFGLHQIRMYKSKSRIAQLYIIVLCNLFETQLTIDVRYDLKGSTYGRATRQPGQTVDKNVALKDLDYLEDKIKINLNQGMYKQYY